MNLVKEKNGKADDLFLSSLRVLYDGVRRRQDDLDFIGSFVDAEQGYYYVVRMEDHTIVWANSFVRNDFGEDCIGKLCYEVFQGLPEPCNFCTDTIIKNNDSQTYRYPFYNKKLGRFFVVEDFTRELSFEGFDSLYRFERAVDITDILEEIVALANQHKNGNG